MPAQPKHATPVALITGAGSGIGRATALALAGEGWRLSLVGRTLAKLQETAQLASRCGTPPVCILEPVDVADAERSRAAVARARSVFGRLDAVIHAAGVAPMGSIADVAPQDWRQCVDTNLGAAVHLAAAAWPVFRDQGQGVVVNLSSMASLDPFPGFNIYAATKAGLNMLTLCLAREGAALGVRAVCIAPGAVETPMLRSLFDAKSLPPERCLQPAEVAALIVDCVLGKRAFEPGQTLTIQK